jgi:hypothetical protein
MSPRASRANIAARWGNDFGIHGIEQPRNVLLGFADILRHQVGRLSDHQFAVERIGQHMGELGLAGAGRAEQQTIDSSHAILSSALQYGYQPLPGGGQMRKVIERPSRCRRRLDQQIA